MEDVSPFELQQLLPGVDRVELVAAAEQLHPARAAAGEVIIEQGQQDAAITLVLEGVLEILREGYVLAVVGPGQMLGEVSLFGQTYRTATARARTPCRVLHMSAADYEALCQAGSSIPAVVERLALEQLAPRRRNALAQVAELARGQPSPLEPRRPEGSWLQRARRMFRPASLAAEAPRPAQVDRAALLASTPAFSDAPSPHLERIASLMQARRAPAGHVLYRQGDRGDRWYLVGRGRVQRYVHTEAPNAGLAPAVHDAGEAGPGDILGATALLDGRPRLVSCLVQQPAILLSIAASTWHRQVASNEPAASSLRRGVLRILVAQLADETRMIVDLQARSSSDDPGSTSD